MDTADAVVIGGGVMGTSVAFNLARRGVARVLLLEQHTICSGTSAKSSAIVRTHYTTRPTAKMALLARRMFERWSEEIGGESGFVRTGMLLVGTAASRPGVERTLAMNQAVGIEARMVGTTELRELAPRLRVADDAPVVWEPLSGYASPHEVASSFARGLTALGGQIRQQTPVTGIVVEGRRVAAVRTPSGDIGTPHVVIAAGPWARTVGRLAGLDLPVTARREALISLRPPFAFDGHPVVLDLANDVYIRPETGNLMLLGSTRDVVVPGDPDRYEDRPAASFTAEVVERLTHLLPASTDAVITGGWSGMYEVSPDWNPIMGSAAGTAGLHYAVGFSGHGFKLSPVVGVLMAEQVTEGRASTLDITPYRLERFAEGQDLRVGYEGAGVIG